MKLLKLITEFQNLNGSVLVEEVHHLFLQTTDNKIMAHKNTSTYRFQYLKLLLILLLSYFIFSCFFQCHPIFLFRAEEKSDFDFMDEMSSPRLPVRRTGESTPKGSAKKKTASFNGVLSTMLRHRRLEQQEINSSPKKIESSVSKTQPI